VVCPVPLKPPNSRVSLAGATAEELPGAGMKGDSLGRAVWAFARVTAKKASTRVVRRRRALSMVNETLIAEAGCVKSGARE
jgi:hypothetical protein